MRGRWGEEGGGDCGVRGRGLWGVGSPLPPSLACIRRCRSDVLTRKTLFRAHGFREAVGLGGVPGEEVELREPSCELGSRLGRKGGLSTWMECRVWS